MKLLIFLPSLLAQVVTFHRPKSSFRKPSLKDENRIIGDPTLPHSQASMCDNIYFYDQKQDHFNFKNKKTFRQKYIYWEPDTISHNGLLLYTGNEGDIETFCQNAVLQYDIAVKNNYAVLW